MEFILNFPTIKKSQKLKSSGSIEENVIFKNNFALS